MSYDTNNIFAKILRREIPATVLYEDDFALAFPDIAPVAPTHVLVIPKGAYENYTDFMSRASRSEITGFFAAIQNVAEQLGVQEHFRLISNSGTGAGQSVLHFHMHILAGKPMGALL